MTAKVPHVIAVAFESFAVVEEPPGWCDPKTVVMFDRSREVSRERTTERDYMSRLLAGGI